MNRFKNLIIGMLVLLGCEAKRDFDPDAQLTATQKHAILSSIVRYAGRKPENVSDVAKFDARYDSFYTEQANRLRLEQYAAKGDDYYFLISQPSASLTEKRNATGGRFRLDDAGDLTEYEEIFRTWKMIPDTLTRRGQLLFARMVDGKSLAPYFTKNSNGIEYIEFPDDQTYFDSKERLWKLK